MELDSPKTPRRSLADSNAIKEKIRSAINLKDLVSEQVVLRKVGSNFSGLCPFHSERSPSFSVSEVKQVFHCYGCKRGGDVFAYVMEMHGIGFAEALHELALRAKISIGGEDANGGQGFGLSPEFKMMASAHKLTMFVTAFYRKQLAQVKHAQKYYESRGILDEEIREFYLGYAPSEHTKLVEHLKAAKAPLKLAESLGLIRKSERNPGDFFDLLRQRAVFPISDLRGHVVGFTGRIVGEDQGQGPKYLNSPESFLFKKSKAIYGVFQARPHIREKGEVILVEGQFDVLKMVQAGFKNTVCTSGTAVTIDHLRILNRLANRIVLVLDSDRAGVQATDRAMETALAEGIAIYSTQVPGEKDPADYLDSKSEDYEHRVGVLHAAIQNSKTHLDQKVSELILQAKQGPEEKVRAIKQMMKWMEIFSDPVGRKVRLDWFQKETQEKLRLNSVPPSLQRNDVKKPLMKEKAIPTHDLQLITLLVHWKHYGQLLEELRAKLPPKMSICDLFEHPIVKEFAVILLKKCKDKEEFDILHSDLFEELTHPQVKSTIREALLNDSKLLAQDELAKLIRSSLSRIWARYSHSLKQGLATLDASKNESLHAELSKEFLDVQRKLKEFSYFI